MIPGLHLASWVEWVIKFAALSTALAVLGKYGLKVFRFFTQLGDGISYVKQQMENNGGSSALDKLDRIEALATHTVERLDALDARVLFLEEVHRKQVEVEAIVAANAARLKSRPYLPPKEAS
jgi:hypothetical protein